MMNKFSHILLVTWLLVCAVPIQASAKTSHRFLFWYPGEAGTTAQAQPLLDEFAAYLAEKIPETRWEPRYFATIAEGKRYVKQKRPVFGIVSHLMYAQFGETLGMQRVLLTKPLPHGQSHESWYLVDGPCAAGAKRSGTTYASEPIPLRTAQTAFPNAELTALSPTENLLGKLKQIGAGSCERAILNEREWYTISRLRIAWRAGLQETKSHNAHPSPSVVQFRKVDAEIAGILVAVLRGMSADPEGKEILQELRLAGFR